MGSVTRGSGAHRLPERPHTTFSVFSGDGEARSRFSNAQKEGGRDPGRSNIRKACTAAKGRGEAAKGQGGEGAGRRRGRAAKGQGGEGARRRKGAAAKGRGGKGARRSRAERPSPVEGGCPRTAKNLQGMRGEARAGRREGTAARGHGGGARAGRRRGQGGEGAGRRRGAAAKGRGGERARRQRGTALSGGAALACGGRLPPALLHKEGSHKVAREKFGLWGDVQS